MTVKTRPFPDETYLPGVLGGVEVLVSFFPGTHGPYLTEIRKVH